MQLENKYETAMKHTKVIYFNCYPNLVTIK